jgi:hypothetical protein
VGTEIQLKFLRGEHVPRAGQTLQSGMSPILLNTMPHVGYIFPLENKNTLATEPTVYIMFMS